MSTITRLTRIKTAIGRRSIARCPALSMPRAEPRPLGRSRAEFVASRTPGKPVGDQRDLLIQHLTLTLEGITADAVTRGRAIAFTRQKSGRWRVRGPVRLLATG